MIRQSVKWVSAVAVLAALTACGSGDDPADEGSPSAGSSQASEKVTVGVVGASEDYWKVFTDLAAEEGIEVELVDFSDYQQPNPALSQGQLDLNQFQHLQFLAAYNVNADDDLTPIGATAVYPLGLYSLKHDSVEDIPEGGEIAIPNDPTNLSRALLVLQDAGLVTLKDGGTSFSTEADVIAEESRVKVTAVDAAQTAIALRSVDASVINNDFTKDAGLDPADAIYADKADSPAARPYINVWVARAEDKDNPTYLKLVELYHSAEVEEASSEASGGTAVFANQSGEELTGWLREIEENLKAKG